MVRTPTLRFDRGTLILHPPPRGKGWIDHAVWDDRIERFRIPAHCYRPLLESLRQEQISVVDQASDFTALELTPQLTFEPYPHQSEALQAWQKNRWRGVVVLPTAAGKTYLAQLALQAIPRSVLITVPTLDLMHQWFAHLQTAFPDADIGLLGGGSRDRTDILVATYDSAAIHAESLGNRYGLLVCDECHHLPSDFNRVIAEYAIAPYRLGLTATPDRADGRHTDLDQLLGPVVYHKTAAELSGLALAPYQIVQLKVSLSEIERRRYTDLIQQRNDFLQQSKIWLGSPEGWKRFVTASARSQAGRRAMLAHREAKTIALGTAGKLQVLEELLGRHYPDHTIIFTNDNATVYKISQDFLIPAITHQTPVKERREILKHFRTGDYHVIVVSHVLNEGVDVPEARIAVLLSGSGSTREYIQRLGRVLRKGDGKKVALLYEVIAEETTEENIARRRKQSPHKQDQAPIYPTQPVQLPLAAEAPADGSSEDLPY